jgi:hypothetical protein
MAENLLLFFSHARHLIASATIIFICRDKGRDDEPGKKDLAAITDGVSPFYVQSCTSIRARFE